MTPVWLALRLPSLALEAHAPVPSPSAIVEHGRVVIGDAAAQAAGVAPGTGVAAARALAPAMALLARDRPREAAVLRALACWAGKLTSRVAVLTDGLLLEVGTCLRLFGGLETLYTLALSGATAQGFSVVAATAPTPLAAEWLARWRPGMCCAADQLKACLDGLPVEALPGEAATALGRFGLRTLGEVRRLPSAALSRRVGEESLRQLGRAYGECVDPRPDFVFPERFAQALTLPAPVDQAAALLFAARRLSAALSGWLAVRQSGVREVRLRLQHRQDETSLYLRFAEATADEDRLERVLRERLERTSLTAPVEVLSLEAAQIEALCPRSGSLLEHVPAGQTTIGALLERLAARLGEDRVYRIATQADHRPEGATRRLSSFGPYVAGALSPQPRPPRPFWLLEAPEPLPEVDGRPHRRGPLTLLSSPERIESGWWDSGEQQGDVRRDYFIALDRDGTWLWIYRECRAGGWFLHGYFA